MPVFKIQPIDRSLLQAVQQKALDSPRKRMNHNFHEPQDTVQRFLNAIEPGSYIRPHRHLNPVRDEIFLVLKGKGAVVVFDDLGRIETIHPLDTTEGYWGIDIEGGAYHTIVSLEEQSIFYEIKPGPYNPDADKGFAPWSPEENTEMVKPYLKKLEDKISKHFANL